MAWIEPRPTKSGERRWKVGYRLGGRESKTFHGGSFKTKREAEARRAYIEREIAAMRVPNLRLLDHEPAAAPTLREAAETWRASRVDVGEQTGDMHRSAFGRIFKVAPTLATRRISEITVADVATLVAALRAEGYKRETIKKSRGALAMALDFFAIDPNPARDPRVKLPKERKAHVPPPLAEHVERIGEIMPRDLVLPLLVIEECGPRISEIVTARVGDLDEDRRAIRIRPTFEKNERYRFLQLPGDLFASLVASLPPHEDRNLDAPLFPGLTDARLRVAISRACKATGTPHFSPHGLRRRRGSLYYKRTGSLADVAELLGDSKRVAADHYVYALTDYREVDRSMLLRRITDAAPGALPVPPGVMKMP